MRHLTLGTLVTTCALLASLLLTGGGYAQTPAPAKVALLIGDWDYNRNNIPDPADQLGTSPFYDDLDQTCKDEQPERNLLDVEQALRKQDFKIYMYCNLEKDGFSKKLTDFGALTKTLPKGSIVFVYFTGHGIQSYGHILLMPVLADKAAISSAWKSNTTRAQVATANLVANPISELFNSLTEREDVAVVIALDNCRNNPFIDSYAFKNSDSNEDVNPRTRRNILIQYRTLPTKTASDTNTYGRILSEEITRGGDIATIMLTADKRLTDLHVANAEEDEPNLNGAGSVFGGGFYLGHPAPVSAATLNLKVDNALKQQSILTPQAISPKGKRKQLRVLWCEGAGEIERRAYAQTFANFVSSRADEFGISEVLILPLSTWKNQFGGYGNVNRNVMRYDDHDEAILLTQIARAYPKADFLPQKGIGIKGMRTVSLSAFVCGAVPQITDQEIQTYSAK
ncbi:caspase family protein [Asticcacaulis benevestitus]|uniref:Peptidase C14 caspase domain-containing protein n=1 Tax=Asticcacaulis benevestitus DSM 16100 = ATCC BAA-896 TaxID=1121022 RepID=V4PNE3_9CAUL|nr:caspase family protein [Asticcacaulis benevestitus]ESQ89771.1 hypothetical protein ABENE_13595 [Asticcacaulis benevestitus DSM 16100 = ATCC BAA-896]